MKMLKSALKYFVHLIKLGSLVERRNLFHQQYAIQARIDKSVKYDAEGEYVEFEEVTDDFIFINTAVNFGKTIRTEVALELKDAKLIIYDRLTSGLLAEQEAFCQQVMRDIEELIGIVDEHFVYAKYPYIADALCNIRDFVTAHQPLSSGQTQVAKTTVTGPVMERVVGFHYRCYEGGTSKENKSLARHLLGNLFLELKDKLELIAPDTSLNDFREVFLGRVVTKRIRWVGVNNQLYHFIQTISPKLIPHGQKKLDKKWVITAACFVNREGVAFTKEQLGNPGVNIENVYKRREIGELAKILR
jgi:hypothetical protein